MTPQQIALVQTSFAKVVPIAGTAADLFYGRLFEIAPDVGLPGPVDPRRVLSRRFADVALSGPVRRR